MTTQILNEIRVWSAFKPFLRILNAYNCDKFRYGTRWRFNSQNVFYAFSSTMMVFLLLATIILLVWHLIEINVSLENYLVELPIAISILQMEVIFITLLLKNRIITTTIQRLQGIIDQRKIFPIIFQVPEVQLQCKFILLKESENVNYFIRMRWIKAIVSNLQRFGSKTRLHNYDFSESLHFINVDISFVTGDVPNFICHFWISTTATMDFST